MTCGGCVRRSRFPTGPTSQSSMRRNALALGVANDRLDARTLPPSPDEDCVSVEIVDHDVVTAQGEFADKSRDALTVVEAVIVEHDDPADLQSRPDPVHHVLGQFIDVDIDMTKAERIVSNVWAGFVRKYPLKKSRRC